MRVVGLKVEVKVTNKSPRSRKNVFFFSFWFIPSQKLLALSSLFCFCLEFHVFFLAYSLKTRVFRESFRFFLGFFSKSRCFFSRIPPPTLYSPPRARKHLLQRPFRKMPRCPTNRSKRKRKKMKSFFLAAKATCFFGFNIRMFCLFVFCVLSVFCCFGCRFCCFILFLVMFVLFFSMMLRVSRCLELPTFLGYLKRSQIRDRDEDPQTLPLTFAASSPQRRFYYGRLLTYSSFAMRLCEALSRASCSFGS